MNSICSDSGQCITFGLEINKIKTFFNNFNFDYIDVDKIKRVGAVSANGFVTEIPYTREGYTSYAILKSSRKADADNLYYEAFVGFFINKKNLQYSCFLETYGIGRTSITVYNNLLNNMKITRNQMEKGLVLTKLNNYKNYLYSKIVNLSCKYSTRFAVLVQHIKNAKSIGDHMDLYKTSRDFMTLHLVNYLFQIYCPLANLSNEFTHYDLHADNVLIYNPSNTEDKYVTMVYHYDKNDTDVVSFHTFGIAKIIDYGRCYFNDTSVSPPVSSMDMYNVVSDANKTPDCAPNGESYGYTWLDKEKVPGENLYISSQVRNKSHDLRLAFILAQESGKNAHANTKSIREILNGVFINYWSLYLNEKNDILRKMGKKEETDNGFGMAENDGIHWVNKGDDILNVEDMHTALKNLIQNEPYFKPDNDAFFQGKTKIGELHTYLYDDKPMEYIPA